MNLRDRPASFPSKTGYAAACDVICGYRGLVFNSRGRCIHMPSQETLNPSACVRVFPVVERHRLDHPDKVFCNLNIDAGAMWARRIIERLVAAEARPAPASPAAGP